MEPLFATLRQQRWDDHRFYHHSRINQSLHLVSACSFVAAYALVFKYPAVAVGLAWIVGMVSRQCGHFFFEPREYDEINHATHDHKEEIKVGYNLFRKVVLMAVWVLSPLLFLVSPTLFGVFQMPQSKWDYLDHTAMLWLAVGVGGLLFRVVQLFFIQSVQAGIAWMVKILTDPFHDISLYWRSPLYLMRGQLIDPMDHVAHGLAADEGDEPTDDDEEEGGQPSHAGFGA